MPLLQRDDDTQPRIRRQSEIDAARQSIEAEDQVSTGAAKIAPGSSSEMNLATMFAAMQASMEANQRKLQDLIAANQEASHRKQEESQRKLKDLITEKTHDGMVTLGEHVKEVASKPDCLEARIDGHDDRLHDLNEKIVKLEARVPILMSAPAGFKLDLPRCDGTSSWTAFKYQFETLVKTNRWDEEQSFAALTLALRGDALLVLEDLPADGRSLERLMAGLDTRYGDKYLEHVFRAQLRERTQKINESIQQWGIEVEGLVRHAYVSMAPDTVEVYLVQAFIDGLRDTEVRAAVRLGHHQTLKSAMAHALEMKAVRQDTQTHRVREVITAPSTPLRYREMADPPSKERNMGEFVDKIGLNELTGGAANIGRAVLAEFIGNLLLNLFGCGACINILQGSSAAPNIVLVALAFGLAVFASVSAIGHISGGHINPAVTIGLASVGRVKIARAILYIIAQCAGAAAGSGLLKAFTPDRAAGKLGITALGADVTQLQGFGIEFCLGFVLIFVVCGLTRLDGKTDDMA